MPFLASILLLALTRAELIDRFKAPAVTRADGMVEVVGNCPPEMRREFQVPVAVFVGDICEALYRETKLPRRRFASPAIQVTIGDVTNNVKDVYAAARTRASGERFTRIHVPAPGFADVSRMRIETVKAFYRALKDEELDDAAAEAVYRRTDPEMKIADEYAAVSAWLAGERGDVDDEEALKRFRSVLSPGNVREEDVLRFSSRLFLYPVNYDAPFCGSRLQCSFREAVALSRQDANVRLAAFLKVPSLMVHGVGHGERMNAAVESYALFLRELVAGKKRDEELYDLLDEADAKLKGVLHEEDHHP